jgi:hypothetical protein
MHADWQAPGERKKGITPELPRVARHKSAPHIRLMCGRSKAVRHFVSLLLMAWTCAKLAPRPAVSIDWASTPVRWAAKAPHIIPVKEMMQNTLPHCTVRSR